MPDSGTRAEVRPEVDPEFFLKRYRDIAEVKDLSEEAKAAWKAVMEQAKASGIDIDAYKLVNKFRKWDPRKQQSVFRHFVLYINWLGINFLEQEEMFSNGPPTTGMTQHIVATHARWEAGRAGYEAGKSGTPLDACPHPPDSEEHQAWCKEWRDGDADRPGSSARDIKPKDGDDHHPEDGDEGGLP